MQKIHVAAELLDQALRLYFEGAAFFAVIHLAAAAEEVLGGYIAKNGGVDSLRAWAGLMAVVSDDHSKDARKADWAYLVQTKNAIKHNNFVEECFLDVNPQSEAKEWLSRAVSNYVRLQRNYDLPETELIKRFRAELANREGL